MIVYPYQYIGGNVKPCSDIKEIVRKMRFLTLTTASWNLDDGLFSGYSGNVPRGSLKVPSSFTLRVGNACVLVNVLPRNVLQMASVRPSLSPFGILRTPELFCSLIGEARCDNSEHNHFIFWYKIHRMESGRQSDCLAVRRIVRDIDEEHIASRGSHIRSVTNTSHWFWETGSHLLPLTCIHTNKKCNIYTSITLNNLCVIWIYIHMVNDYKYSSTVYVAQPVH